MTEVDDYYEGPFGGPYGDPPPPPTERDGLTVGDTVLINDCWPAVVTNFNALECDVVVRWTGKRPLGGDEATVCRKHAKVVQSSGREGVGRE